MRLDLARLASYIDGYATQLAAVGNRNSENVVPVEGDLRAGDSSTRKDQGLHQRPCEGTWIEKRPESAVRWARSIYRVDHLHGGFSRRRGLDTDQPIASYVGGDTLLVTHDSSLQLPRRCHTGATARMGNWHSYVMATETCKFPSCVELADLLRTGRVVTCQARTVSSHQTTTRGTRATVPRSCRHSRRDADGRAEAGSSSDRRIHASTEQPDYQDAFQVSARSNLARKEVP